MTRRRLGTRMLVAMTLPALIALVAALVAAVVLAGPLDAPRDLAQIDSVLSNTESLAKAIVDAETGERGFILSGREDFLDPYRDGITTFYQLHDRVARAIEHDPTQRTRAARLETLFNQWRNTWAEPLCAERRRAGDDVTVVTQIAQRIATGRGKVMMDEMRALTEQIMAGERAEQARIVATSERATRRGRALTIAGPIAAVFIAIAIGTLLSRRAATGLESVLVAVEGLARGETAARAAVQGDDELSAVARAFNAMADKLAHRTAEMSALRELGEYLQSCSSLDEAYGVITQAATTLFPTAQGAVFVTNPSRTLALPVAAWNDHAARTGEAAFALDECWALRRGNAHRADSKSSVHCAHEKREANTESLCVPLVAHGEAMGVLHLVAPTGTTIDDRMAGMVADQLGLSFANLRLRDSLREQSIRDALTGLYNRRYVEDALEREIRRATRTQRPLSALFFDVDHFKQFNDTFGHEAGDVVLMEMGKLVRSTIRAADVGCRYGGEEFVVLLPETNTDEALRCAERLRESARALRLSHQGRLLRTVTLSLGVATLQAGESGGSMLRRADEALYAAKTSGRDRVMSAEIDRADVKNEPDQSV